jgi:tetratricopeptide (TPR) repeat protein
VSARSLAVAAAVAALAGAAPACAYFNTFYNAEQAFAEGERLVEKAPPGADLPPAARAAYRKSVEKSSRVLSEHGGSGWADDALLLLAKAHYRLGNHAESSAALRALLHDHPESGHRREAMLWMTRVGREAGDYESAARVAEELLAAGELSGEDRLAVELELAETALAAGEPDRALAIYDALRRDAPRLAADHGVDLLAARARLARGDAEGALGDLRAIIAAEGDPQRKRDAALAVAEALTAEGRREEGLQAYRELLEAGVPDSTGAAIRLILAEAHEADGDAAAAAEELGAAARLVPSTPLAARALYRRGLLEWREMARRGEAKGTLMEAYLQDPEGEIADSALAAARVIAEIEHYEAIRSGRERVLAPVAPEEVDATATYLLAELLYAQEGDEAGARALFEEILAEHPRSAWTPKVLYTLGWLAQQRGAAGREEALERYGAVEREHPDTEYARYAAARRAEILGLAPLAADGSGAGGPSTAFGTGPDSLGAAAFPGAAPGADSSLAAGGVTDPARVAAADSTPAAADALARGEVAAGGAGAADSAAIAPGPAAGALAGGELAAAGALAEDAPAIAPDPAAVTPDSAAAPGLLPLPPDGAAPVPGALLADAGADVSPGAAASARTAAARAAAPRGGTLDAAALAEVGGTRDQVLLLLSRALPRPPDPLVGLEDRLGARQDRADERGLTPGEIERRREQRALADTTAGPGGPDPAAPGPGDDAGAPAGPGAGPADGTGGPGDGRLE